MANSNEAPAPAVTGREASEQVSQQSDTSPNTPSTTPSQRTARRHEIRALIMAEVNRHRIAARMSMDPFCVHAGLSERYFSKALHAHEASGREPNWTSLQAMIDVLFPDGLSVVFTPIPGPRRKEMIAEYKRRFPRTEPFVDDDGGAS